MRGDGFLNYCLWVVTAAYRLVLLPADAQALWCSPPAEDAALGAVSETRRNLEATVSWDAIKALLVAVLLPPRAERLPHPGARLHRAVCTH